MNGYPPHKMCPKCAVEPFVYYDTMFNRLGKKKQSSIARKVTKDHHTKRTRRYGVDEIKEGMKEIKQDQQGKLDRVSGLNS